MSKKSAIALLVTLLVVTKSVAVVPNGEAPVLELYMHGILGGSNPTARPMTGLLGNIYSGQLGQDGLGLGFGTITVIDDYLTAAVEGVYVASSADGTTQMMGFTAMMEGGEFGDSINFFGVYRIGSSVSRLSVTGGRGSLRMRAGLRR
ncbi:hypothetical protein SASPL_111584 [Salvia splendens]|uniref:Dirigent protein n=1 Tax=Salvia splendens TaxID=180675 RepID=A0A8X8YB14_SALSN|nr:hypothetical protein SASPL_111584 [Salvia splendens]